MLKYLIILFWILAIILKFYRKADQKKLFTFLGLQISGDRLIFNNSIINYLFVFVVCFWIFDPYNESVLYFSNIMLFLIATVQVNRCEHSDR